MNPPQVSLALFALLSLEQLADIYSTARILTKPGGVEQNPLMAKLFAALGVVPGLLLVKGVLLGALWLFALDYPLVLGGLCAFYAWILRHNWQSL